MIIEFPLGLLIFYAFLGVLAFLGIACCIIDTVIRVIQYIEYKQYIKETIENDSSGGN